MKEDNFMPLVVRNFQETLHKNNAHSHLSDAIVSEYLSLMEQQKAITAAMLTLGAIMNNYTREGGK